MENHFISEYFDWKLRPPSRKSQMVNRILELLGFYPRLMPPTFTGLMTNVEQRMNMYHLVSQVLAFGVPGDLVELGCNTGQSAVLFEKVIQFYDPTRKLHVYDSFEGLPKLSEVDGGFLPEGGLPASQEKLLENFRSLGLRVPEIHRGWFKDTLPDGLPEKIAFAHLDGDFYESILVSLEYVYPRLSKGAICLVDDYCADGHWPKLPGVKKACDEFLAGRPERVSELYAGEYSHGYFRKL